MATPLSSFLGGLGLTIPVQVLLTFNGSVFGISGFFHRGVKGQNESLFPLAGLLLGGFAAAYLDHHGPETLDIPLWQLLASGVLVGVGTKLGSGCTSGHMICGLSRFSQRSLVATCTFFTSASIVTYLIHGDRFPATPSTMIWSLGSGEKVLIVLQGLLMPIYMAIRVLADPSAPTTPQTNLRRATSLITGISFALALRLSNLVDPRRVLQFLLLPFNKAFDPSLAFLAAGALPLATLQYAMRGKETPRLGGQWSVTKRTDIDPRLIVGAVLFGVGWGISGICPGPGIVNLGRAIWSGENVQKNAMWLVAVAFGGLLT